MCPNLSDARKVAPGKSIQLKCQGNKIFKNLLTLTLRYSLEWYYTEGVINMRTVKEVSKLTGVSVRTLH